MTPVSTWTRRSWIVALSCFLLLFGVLLALTPYTQGLPLVTDTDGSFLLQKRGVEKMIPQWFGWILFCLTSLLVLFSLGTVVLILPVFVHHGTLKIPALLDEESPQERWIVTLFHVACFVLAIGFVMTGVQIIAVLGKGS